MAVSKPVPRRWFRLQFSLRMMLFLTAAVGVALTVFRWPWEETIEKPSTTNHATRTITYRRGWNGKRLKHGSERIVINLGTPSNNSSGLLWYEAYHFDDELRREWKFDPPGQVKTEISHYPERGEKRVRYFADLARDGLVLEVTSWKANQRLKREWRTFEGRLLESQLGEYIDTFDLRQIEWNGQPLEKALPGVLAELPDATARAAWLAPQSTGGMKALAFLGDGTILLQAKAGRHAPREAVGPLDVKPDEVLVHFAHQELPSDLELHFQYNTDTKANDANRPAPSLAEQLLGYAAQHDSTLCCRFGVVCIVPIAQAMREPKDPTGVFKVSFPAGSPAALDWLELVDGLAVDVSPPSSRLQQFFAGTSIAVDVTRLQSQEPTETASRNLRTGISLRPRRDLLGLFLWQNGCRVEQQGNQLVVRSRKE